MPASEQAKPVLRPYLAAAKEFASGTATPRQFLERSLELFDLWEPRIGAFVCTNLPAARAAADKLDRALARRQAAVADRRHAGRHQGHYRDRRHADGNGLAAVRRLALGEGRRQCARAARGRRRHSRQDGDHGIRRVASRAARAIPGIRRTRRAARRAARRPRSAAGIASAGARHAGDRLDDPPGELLRLFRLQAERERAQPRRLSRLSEPELHRHSRRFARRHLAGRA